MSVATTCPGPASLRDLIAGRLAAHAAAAARAHLAECGRCRRDFEALAVPAAEETRPFDPGPTTAPMTPAPPPLGSGGAGRARAEEADLVSLEPARRPGSLGRIGRYEVLDLLGRGGMGIVFKARDDRLKRTVAVKVLAPALATAPNARRRFLREARAAAAIGHPNVVVVHEVRVHRGRLPFLVMEYLRGRTLRERLREGPRPTAAEVARVATEVAAGLAAAHERGIVHRDVNPANIMLDGRPERAKLTDFGLARVADGLSELSANGRVFGTPSFMSPEQVIGGPIDARSDLYSLGVVIYAMFLGRSPFLGGHVVEVARRVCDHRPDDLDEVAPDCPPALSAIAMRLLEKRPDDRFPSATALMEALRPLLAPDDRAGAPAAPPAPTRRPPKPAPMPAELADGPEFATAPTRTAEVALTVLATLATLLVAGVLLLLVNHMARSRTDADSVPAVAAPRAPVVWTVGAVEGAGSRSLGEALARALPGDTIRIVDSRRYEGPFLLDDPGRYRGLTIEAAPGAAPTLAATTGGAVVLIRGTPGLTLRGLRFATRPDQHAVKVEGTVEGLTLAGLQTAKPDGVASWAHLYLAEGARGTPERPIVVRDCRIEGGRMGLVLEGDSGRPVAHVRVLANLFLGAETHLDLLQNLRDVQVADNRFAGGGVALWVNLPAGRGEGLVIEQNTILDVGDWLGPAESSPSQRSIVVRRNAILGRPSGAFEGLLAGFVGGWRFEGNLRESGPDGPAARARPALEVRSRSPDEPGFLRPSPGSALLGDGRPGSLVGARPAGARPSP